MARQSQPSFDCILQEKLGLKTLVILELLSCCLGGKLERLRVSYKDFTYEFILRVVVEVEN